MDMKSALIIYLKEQLASGKLNANECARAVEEIQQAKRRVVRPRDTSKDGEPITVGVML